jgi:hypothetical protein
MLPAVITAVNAICRRYPGMAVDDALSKHRLRMRTAFFRVNRSNLFAYTPARALAPLLPESPHGLRLVVQAGEADVIKRVRDLLLTIRWRSSARYIVECGHQQLLERRRANALRNLIGRASRPAPLHSTMRTSRGERSTSCESGFC